MKYARVYFFGPEKIRLIDTHMLLSISYPHDVNANFHESVLIEYVRFLSALLSLHELVVN